MVSGGGPAGRSSESVTTPEPDTISDPNTTASDPEPASESGDAYHLCSSFPTLS